MFGHLPTVKLYYSVKQHYPPYFDKCTVTMQPMLSVVGFCSAGAGSHTVKINLSNCYQTGEAHADALTGAYTAKLTLAEVFTSNTVENSMYRLSY